MVWISVSWKEKILRGNQELGDRKERELHACIENLDLKHDKTKLLEEKGNQGRKDRESKGGMNNDNNVICI